MLNSSVVIGAVAGVAIVVIAMQGVQNSELKKEKEELQQKLATGKSGGGIGGSSAGAGGSPKSSPGVGAREKAIAGGQEFRADELRDILAITDPIKRAEALVAFAAGLRAEDIKLAVDELRAGSAKLGPEERMLAHMLLARWAQEDPDAALASLGGGTLSKRNWGDSASIIGGLAEVDPERAAAWLADDANAALTMNPWTGRMLASTLARSWVAQDAEAALAWAESLDGEQRAGAYEGIIGTLAEDDPKRASELAMTLEGEARVNALREVAQVWARRSPEAAAAWAQSLSGEDRRRALGGTINVWAQSEPAAAASFLDSAPAEERDGHLVTVAANWSRQNPTETAQWVTGQPEGEGRNNAMGYTMWNWTNQDPEAAGRWLRDQPESELRDHGIAGLAKAAAEFDQEAALDWAVLIADEARREGSVNHALRRWHREDPGSAEQWATANQVEIPQGGGGGKGGK